MGSAKGNPQCLRFPWGILIRRCRPGQSHWSPGPNWGPLFEPEIRKFSVSDFKIDGALGLDDDRLTAAVSHAGFGSAVSVGCTSALERIFKGDNSFERSIFFSEPFFCRED